MIRIGLRLLWALLCWIGLGWQPLRAHATPANASLASVNAEEMSTIAPGVALVHRIDQLKQAFQQANPEAIENAAREIEWLRNTYATLDMTPLAEAIAIWSRDLGMKKQGDIGIKAVKFVEQRWMPHHPALMASYIILSRQQGIQGYIMSLPQLYELTRLRLSRPVHRWLWIVQHSAWLRLMASTTLWGFALAMVLRYRNVLRDLWEAHLFQKGYGSFFAAILGALILTWPVILGLDPAIMALFWLWLLAPFMHTHEVKAAYVVIVLQFLHPALAIMAPRAQAAPEPSVRAIQTQPQLHPPSALGTTGLPPLDQDFLVGWQQLQNRQWLQAVQTFSLLVDKHPDRAAVINNRGVARFELGRVDEAEEDFEAAFHLDSRHPEILHNQSVTAFKKLDTASGIAKQEEARKYAPALYESLRNASQAQTEQRTFPVPMPDSHARQAALRHSLGVISAQSPLSVGMIGWLLIPVATLIAFIIRLSRSMRQAHPTQCIRCGDPFHTTDSADVEVCSKCHHLFVLKDGLHGENRKQKTEEVTTFQHRQRFLHRLLVICLPGADRCFLGYSKQGFFELLFFASALGLAFASGRGVRYPGELLDDPHSLLLPVGLVLLATIFLSSWRKLLPGRRHH